MRLKKAKRLSELTETDRSEWTNVDHKLGRRQLLDGRGASKVAPRWNETNSSQGAPISSYSQYNLTYKESYLRIFGRSCLTLKDY